MKFTLALLAVFLALPLFSQSLPNAPSALPTNVYAFGPSYNQSASPKVAGTALYARLLDQTSETYAFTVVDVLPNNTKPFTVTTNIGVGVAQKLFTIGKVPVFAPGSAGVSINGSNTGWNWTAGAMASVKVKNSWHVYPNVRVAKSSVSGGTGYQPILGVLIGWQQ